MDKSTKPTKTTNRIRLTDLEPRRFEDLCLMILYPTANWKHIHHYGRTGNDGGVDIHGIEKLEGDIEREWIIQCKRQEKASAKDTKQIVDEALKNNSAPDVLLAIFGCDLSRKARDAYFEYAVEKGVKTPQVWALSEIEAKLYNERKDLLFTFFGISEAHESRKKETAIRRNISIKKKMYRALRNKNPDKNKAREEPRHQFADSNFIIRSVDDSCYPEVDEAAPFQISSWFKVESWDYYWNGLEVLLGGEEAIIDDKNNWALIECDDDFDKEKFERITVLRIGRIPFRNIIDFDEDGDGYYRCPHIFCTFADGGMPYEEFSFAPSKDIAFRFR